MPQCRYCKETIVTNARYCKECGHWQGWYGALLGHLSLGDITVAITLIALLLATFRSLLFGDHAELLYTRLSCSEFTMTVLTSNTGERNGALADFEFVVENGGRVDASLTIDDVPSDIARLPQTGAVALVTANMNSGAKPRLFGDVDESNPACSVELVAQGFGMRQSPQLQTIGKCSCREFTR